MHINKALIIQKFAFPALIILSVLMHISIFKKELIGIHVWRQSITQLNTSNFYNTDINILNPRANTLDANGNQQIIRTDFPLMQWLIAQIFFITGESIFVTRVCIFITGLFTVLGFFFFCKQVFGNFTAAFVAAWAFNFSPLFYYYTLNPLPDSLALCCIVWSLYWFSKYRKEYNQRFAVYAAVYFGIGMLIKLPYIIFGAIYFCHFLIRFIKPAKQTSIKPVLYFAFTFMAASLPAAAWYAFVIPQWGENPLTTGKFNYSNNIERANEILDYHFSVLLPTLLLNYASLVLFVTGIIHIAVKKYYTKPFFYEIAAGFAVTLLYFFYDLFHIDTVHDYYMLPFLPFLYMAVGAGANKLFQLNNPVKYLLPAFLLLLPFFTYRTVQDNWTAERSYMNKDLLFYQQELQKAVPNSEPCIMLNDVSATIWPYLLNKKGYTFTNDALPVDWIKNMILTKNIKYMYTDSKLLAEKQEYRSLFDSVLLQRGSIMVIKLIDKNKLN
ncbi:MAG: glycosyltransferase family 39 protein [Chitinophagaceae bacterium]|jgi:4-amino-4-deoxy-L-arabinose transferase-like glycosyltransferase|nr:glycosyltransferase family 39 protein [Chitinophagaceae bacterium]